MWNASRCDVSNGRTSDAVPTEDASSNSWRWRDLRSPGRNQWPSRPPPPPPSDDELELERDLEYFVEPDDVTLATRTGDLEE